MPQVPGSGAPVDLDFSALWKASLGFIGFSLGFRDVGFRGLGFRVSFRV